MVDGQRPPAPVSALASTQPTYLGIEREHLFVLKRQLRRLGRHTERRVDEHRTLANLAHPCIVAYVEAFETETQRHLVMEYVDGGTIQQQVDDRNPGMRHFNDSTVMLLFVQMLLAVEYLHRHNVLHRDLKAANVLISKKWLAKLADFGFAKQFDDDIDAEVSLTVLGTPHNMSPCVVTRRPYSDKADMWSLGVILYELLTLEKPFPGDSVEVVALAIATQPPEPIRREGLSPNVLALISMLLDKNPKRRPSARQVLQMPVIADALEGYVTRYTEAARTSRNPADMVWARVLREHAALVLQPDGMTSPKAMRAQRTMRSVAARSAASIAPSTAPVSRADSRA